MAALAAKTRTVDPNTIKLIEELKELSRTILSQRINRLFDGADDMLFEMAGRASNNREQGFIFDAMRVVRLNREKIRQSFLREVVARFEPDTAPEKEAKDPIDISLDEMTLQGSQAVEKSIAISNMATKAEELYKQQLWELGRRVSALILDLRAPLSSETLTPASICAAFDVATEALDVEFEIRLVIYKLFDRLVIVELADLYSKVLRFLDQAGVQVDKVRGATVSAPKSRPSPTAVPNAAEAAPPPPFGANTLHPPASPAFMGGPANQAYYPSMGAAATQPPSIDPQTLQLLERLGGKRRQPVQNEGYTDHHLASDLASAALGRIVPGWDEPHAVAYVQRASAVGQMFNQILSDPNLPLDVKPQLDQLRFSVIKTALRDVSFFANPSHPVRGLVNELATLAATARASSMDTLHRIEELVGQIQQQFDVAASSVRASVTPQRPIQNADVEKFLAEQLAQSETRRQAIIAKVRRTVSEELQLHTMDRRIPEAAKPMLNSGWAPMMAVRLLRHGMDSEEWRSGLALLKRILTSVDLRVAAPTSRTERDTLAAELQQNLSAINLAEQRITELLAQLEQAQEEADVARLAAKLTLTTPRPDDIPPHPLAAELEASTATPAHVDDDMPLEKPDAARVLELLVVPGTWFRVYDHEGENTRWLKMVAYYPNRDVIAFAEFNGKNTLLLKTAVLINDLIAGRVEPLDASPKTRHILNLFLAERRAAEPA
jgi:hypothetical protein